MPSNTLTLVQFETTEDIPNYSPFCVKAEVLLKMSGLPYDIEILDDPRKSKKGKLPMVRDGDRTIADSEFIKKFLTEEKGVDFDGHLSPREQAQAHAFSKMVDERLYWTLVYDRWIEDDNWPTIRDFWFGKMPFPIGALISRIARKSVRKNLNGHGIGLHSRDEIYVLRDSDLNALAAQLGDQDFLFGDKPCTADASAFGVLVNADRGILPSNLKQVIKSYPTLVAYVERCMQRWFAK